MDEWGHWTPNMIREEMPEEYIEDPIIPYEYPDTETALAQHIDAKIESLNNRFDGLIEVVKNMSMRLEEISCDVKGLMNNGKTDNLNSKRDIVGEFHNLKQTGSVAEYEQKFNELRDLLMTMNYGLTEDYYISSFLSGLKEEIRRATCEPRPETLVHAFNLARIQETAFKLMKEKLISSETRIDPKQLLPCETVDCFITYGHPQMFRVLVGERVTTVVLSTGMPYNFIDTDVAMQAGCEMVETEPVLVKFLGGHEEVSRFVCPRLRWTVDGHEFVTDVRVVKIKACEMVLSGNWAFKHVPTIITKDKIIVHEGGKAIKLLDKSESSKCKMNKESNKNKMKQGK